MSNDESTAAQLLPEMGAGLKDLENIIARGLPSYDAVAIALLEIHERKLYSKLYGSFQEYVKRRWQFSRARAYQMLHFARLKRLSTTVDTDGPENERQARALDAQGNLRAPGVTDPILAAMMSLGKLFERLPFSERRELIESVADLLAEFEQILKSSSENPFV